MTFTKNGKNRLDEVSAPIERSTEQRPKGQAIFVRQIYSFKKFTIARLIAVGLSAYDVSRYGALEGSVIHVASNTTEQEGIPPFYETLIAIPDPVFATTGVAPDIVPGMQVTVDIIGGKRTVMDYILSPIQRATEVAFREK